MDHILDSHGEQTVERCGAEPLVLAIQATTTLNHDGLAVTADPAAIQMMTDGGGGGKGTRGLARARELAQACL